MATTSELRAIMQELDLVDIGDAASYLGEEAALEEMLALSEKTARFSMEEADELLQLVGASAQE